MLDSISYCLTYGVQFTRAPYFLYAFAVEQIRINGRNERHGKDDAEQHIEIPPAEEGQHKEQCAADDP